MWSQLHLRIEAQARGLMQTRSRHGTQGSITKSNGVSREHIGAGGNMLAMTIIWRASRRRPPELSR